MEDAQKSPKKNDTEFLWGGILFSWLTSQREGRTMNKVAVCWCVARQDLWVQGCDLHPRQWPPLKALALGNSCLSLYYGKSNSEWVVERDKAPKAGIVLSCSEYTVGGFVWALVCVCMSRGRGSIEQGTDESSLRKEDPWDHHWNLWWLFSSTLPLKKKVQVIVEYWVRQITFLCYSDSMRA